MRLVRTSALAASVAALVTLSPGVADAAPNDPLYAKQWGPQQVRAEQAWPTSAGAGTVIAIVDTGVDLDHPDLKGKLVTGASFIGCKTSCGNGDWRGTDGKGQPDDVHGTHVAGIAAAATGNGIGIAGVARDAKILPIKVLENGSGSFEDIAAGVRHAADKGAKVINLSLGALQGVQALVVTGLVSDLQEAIQYAKSKGVAVIAAAGNDAVPVCNTPGFDDGAVCVVATDRREAPSAYSSGPVRPGLNSVAAPGGSAAFLICGEDVLSLVPRGTGKAECARTDKNYDEFAGTSMAAPHVAGVAALLAAQGRTVDNIYRTMTSTARTPGTDARGVFTTEYGYGIVDAAAAVAAPA